MSCVLGRVVGHNKTCVREDGWAQLGVFARERERVSIISPVILINDVN